MTLKIAFYKAHNGNYLDKTISVLTISKYSHCEIVFSDGVCASSSSRDGGIRFKQITLGAHWDVYEVIGDYDEAAIRYWFTLHSDDAYDWWGAVGSLFCVDWTSEDYKFCSYACASVLGLDPITTPGKLYHTLKKLKTI